MRFIDSLKIKIKAGRGGKGIISFRREAFVNRGGPDGGDGGRGGSVFFKGSSSLNTLFHLFILREIKAEDGKDGSSQNRVGASGKDSVIEVPLGTYVCDQNGRFICDVLEEKSYLVASGGRGGRGNARFKTAKNSAPKWCENGSFGEELSAYLELRYLTDVGFVGKPSAGKSSLLNSISNARSKVGDYDFTTLFPQLGVVRLGKDKGFVVADLPGIIKGASDGKGLGLRFLQHIKRARLLVYVVDCGSEGVDAVADLKEVIEEVRCYQGEEFSEKLYIISTKSDLPSFNKQQKLLKRTFPNSKIFQISILDNHLIDTLKLRLYQWLKESKVESQPTPKRELTYEWEEEVVVKRLFADLFEVSGREVKRIYDLIPLNSYENLQRFNYLLKQAGVWDLLIKKGVMPGATIRIYNYEFSWSGEDI